MVGLAVSPTRIVYVDVTLTQFKAKVTELLKLRKLHFSIGLSPLPFSRGAQSKLMVGGDSMGTDLLVVRARFSNSLLGTLSREFKLRGISIFHAIQMAIFRSA